MVSHHSLFFQRGGGHVSKLKHTRLAHILKSLLGFLWQWLLRKAILSCSSRTGIDQWESSRRQLIKQGFNTRFQTRSAINKSSDKESYFLLTQKTGNDIVLNSRVQAWCLLPAPLLKGWLSSLRSCISMHFSLPVLNVIFSAAGWLGIFSTCTSIIIWIVQIQVAMFKKRVRFPHISFNWLISLFLLTPLSLKITSRFPCEHTKRRFFYCK